MAAKQSTDLTLAIGDIAKAAGVSASAIRFYEREGVLAPAQRSGGRRRYGPAVVQRLRVLEVAKQAGFSLAQIKHLLGGFDRTVPPSQRWQTLTRDKLDEIEQLIARAEAMRALLRRGLECGCLTLDDCELIRIDGLAA
jgi:MerR family redox-sensitive transcriptional activator SoxR